MIEDGKRKAAIIEILKSNALQLSRQEYSGNIKVEIDCNPAMQSAKVKITEYVQ